MDWRQQELSLAAVGEILRRDAPQILALAGVPNARVAGAAATARLLRDDEKPTTVGELRERLAEIDLAGIDPQPFRALAAELDYEVDLGWSRPGTDGAYEVVFRRRAEHGETVPRPLPAIREITSPEPWSRYANNPLQGKFARKVVPELRHFLGEELPEYMLPSAFVLLDAFPLTANGKVDRRALPAPAWGRDETTELVAPRTPAEEALVEIWAALLGVGEVGVRDDFFELGGHSLLATQLVSRVRDTFQVELPLRVVFESPSVAGMAEALEAASAKDPGPPLVRVPRDGDLPLSFAQQRLWFFDRMVPDNPFYNMYNALQLHGPLDVAALRRALDEVVRRHESLRTTFRSVAGEPRQVIAPQLSLTVPLVDLRALPESRRQDEQDRLSAAESRRPFDLTRGPLLRAVLVRLAGTPARRSVDREEHALLLNMHHIISDGWSIGVFSQELATLYEAFEQGKPATDPRFGLEELEIQYADFAVWQRSWLEGEMLERQLAYWKQQLAGAPEVLDLPFDHPRPAIETFRGTSVPLHIPAPTAEGLKALGRQWDATPAMTLLAVFKTLLYRYSGQTDVLVGTAIANRTRSELERLIGFFVNTLVLRTDLSNRPRFVELLGRVRETDLGAYSHQDLPFEKLVEELHLERDLSHHPLCQVMFGYFNFPLPAIELRRLRVSVPDGAEFDTGTSKFDLTLFLGGEQIRGSLEYNSDLFEEATIARLVGHWECLLSGVVEAPERRVSEFSLLSPAQHHQLLVEWNDSGSRSNYGEEPTFLERFADQVRRMPEAPAVVFDADRLSYRELDRRSDQLARFLRARGIGPEGLVGICCERSPEMVVGIVGVLKAGGAWLPLDPSYPRKRLEFMIEDTRVPMVLSQASLVGVLPAHEAEVVCLDSNWDRVAAASVAPPVTGVGPESAAYVIYTSGSTGRPKGVVVSHRGLANLAAAQVRLFGLRPADRVLQFSSLNFDASVWEIAMALSVGASLHLAPVQELFPGEPLRRFLAERRITTVTLPPSALAVLRAEELPALATLIVAGEACSPELAEQWSVGRRFFDAYGPTETTVCATAGRYRRGERLSIGTPIRNTGVQLLDPRMRPVPMGVPGELAVGGAGIARGYLGRPALSAERFVPNPLSSDPDLEGGRLYRTGDLARYLPDGSIEFLGRIDHQVKLRGYRIELGEIEAVLGSHPGISQAVVVVRDNERLAAYAVPSPEEMPAEEELRGFLRERLPSHMLPSAFVLLRELPLTPSGKVDRRALPAPERTARAAEGHVAPRDEIERTIAAVWEQVLEIEEVGVRDNFFDLGGHSLLLIRVHEQLREALGGDLSMIELFQHPSVAALAEHLRGGRSAELRVTTGVRRADLRLRSAERSESEIAVIAMTGRFPGAGDVDRFWRNLRDGVESVNFFSDEELLAAGVDPALLSDPHFVKAGAVLDGVEYFDAQLFGIHPREAEALDPQQRIFLECAWEVLEQAGYNPEIYDGSIGVFAGIAMNRYLFNLFSNPELVSTLGNFQLLMGNDKDFLPTRVSYKLNLKGPSVNVQTACSTSLVATHLACQSLLNGECDMALVGGVTADASQSRGYLYQEGGVASPDGHCRAFDARAQGTIAGSGVGIVVLKRLSAALADGDTIHAVIKGSAINNDGSGKVGFTAPGVEGQAAVIAEALTVAGVEPQTVSYVEAHGTGTPLGDPIEVAALRQVFGSEPGRRCAL
ncbi:MAG: amino acid adenylation domain-containing protein, partial [bacterium]|nr:amino acid adenylation domain-containing protein [bacterium]